MPLKEKADVRPVTFNSGTLSSLFEIVSFAEIAAGIFGAKEAWNGKQKLGPMVVGYPLLGSVTWNCVSLSDRML